MAAEAVDKIDTASPPGSPAKTALKIKNHETDNSSAHSTDNSNGPVENNNDSSSGEDAKIKSNGVPSDDNECSDSKESNGEPRGKTPIPNENSDVAKAKNSVVSNADSKNHTNDEESDNDSQDEDISSDEGSEEGSEGRNAKDTVSLNSDSDPETVDDSTGDGHSEPGNNDVVMIDTPNEVHEINSDEDDEDCVVTNEEKSVNGGSGDSDVEMEEMEEDPLEQKTRKINKITFDSLNSRSLLKTDSNDTKNGSPLVVVDAAKILAGNKAITIQPAKICNSPTTQSISENLAIRGSTITEISVKSANSSPQSLPPAPPLLPTLTDDMFVVEAPSFIVPYVYEKPSIKPFREFVDILGKELEEKKAKEENERLEKEKAEKEKKKTEKEEKRKHGEQVSDSEDEAEKAKKEETPGDAPESKEKIVEENKVDEKKVDKKKGKRKKNEEDDDASWDGESDVESEEEQVSEDDELTTVVIKDKDEDDIEEIKTIAKIMAEEPAAKQMVVKSDSFFDNNLGKFFMNIGLNLVQEYVQTDLLRQQKRKLKRETKMQRPHTKEIESAIKYLSHNIERSKELNEPYNFQQKHCKFCFFKTESAIIMAHHLETPHMKNNIYTCNFCSFEVRSPHDILFHTEAEHNIRSRLERAPAYHQCANCPFEDNGKGKLARHLIACAKKFKPDLNLAPPIDWEPPAKIPKLTRGRNSITNAYNRPPGSAPLGRPPTISAPVPIGRPRGPNMGMAARGQSMLPGAPLMRGGVMIRPAAPIAPINFPMAPNAGKSSHQPSISITPLPRAPQPQASTNRTQGSFVICEICDGYIKDLEQLRSHMQWIHKVKIHPKMIYNRPPLNCQKCQFRFFTDQGLERHLLGSHGLVTSSMQETANQGKDSGRCPVCGRVYQWKLLNHVAKDHNMTLKPAHLSYKCTVCTATFGMYKQFESHVYSAHSAVGKRMADGKPPARVGNSSVSIVPAGKAGAKV